MSIKKPENRTYSINQWQSWINQKCVELQIPALYGYYGTRDWMYQIGKRYGWEALKKASLQEDFNLYDLYAFSYQFLVERSLLQIIDSCDYSEMLGELAA